MATDATWVPMEFFDEQINLTGFDMDLAKEVAKAGGFEVEFRAVAWDSLLLGLKQGTYDAAISSMTISDKDKEGFTFSNPYMASGAVLVVSRSDSATSLADLKGQPVGVVPGVDRASVENTVGKWGARYYEEASLAIDDLFNGKLEGALMNPVVAVQYVSYNSKYRGALKIVGQPLAEGQLGIAVKKGNDELLKKINLGLAAVKANGKLDELKRKWLKVNL